MWLKNHVTVKPLQMNVLFLTTVPTLKTCNSPYMQYYFNGFFVLHSSEVIFSFLTKRSRQKAIEVEIAFFFFIPLGIPRVAHRIISFMLHISVITSLAIDTYIDELIEIFVKLSNENSTSAFNYLDDFSCTQLLSNSLIRKLCSFILVQFHRAE